MADFDTRYYQGTDRYSDGDDNENRLLEIVKSGRTLDELSESEVSWPIVYHLHRVRENVCNWYPFRRGARILEIGSGCGAITGALCRRDCEVWSVDLSKRRATINYERHRDCENLHIVVGNLNDIPFEQPFDYVLLIGVLEYAGTYTEGDAPYRTFLKNIQRFMKPDGRLLIAIENRLGLKYFAGAPEDHLNEVFAGLRGYDADKGVRTFSHSELEALLTESGLGETRFYYPYPDYKFPSEIFTDESLEAMHYGKFYRPMDGDHATLFREYEIAALLAREGTASSLANSFFVEAAFKPMNDSRRVIYVKQNAERGADTRIGTRIVDEGGAWKVYKYAMTPEAGAHLKRILENERALGAHRDVLAGEWTEDGISYPYIEAETADGRLKALLQTGQRERVLELIDRVLALASVNPSEARYAKPAFERWFGPEKLSRPAVTCVRPANIDLILDNIFITEDGYRLVDCEWVADFPVPVAFILWRALNNAYFQYPELEGVVPRTELYERCGILHEDVDTYVMWTQHFESEYVKNKGLERFAREVCLVNHDMAKISEYEHKIDTLSRALDHQLQVEKLDKEYIRGLEKNFQSKSWKLARAFYKTAKLLHLTKEV